MITLVYAYYDNPKMLREHLATWRGYPPGFEAIVVDDASPTWPAKIEPVGFPIRLYRIERDVPWNWLECRNIGALYARGEWLLLTDMDHVLSTGAAAYLLAGIGGLDQGKWYTLRRRGVDGEPQHAHPDSFVMSRDFFWRVGGYDEHYAGNYGTGRQWRSRCGEHGHTDGLPVALTHYSRDDIEDANTIGLERRKGKDPEAIAAVKARKLAAGLTAPGLFMQPYHLVESIGW